MACIPYSLLTFFVCPHVLPHSLHANAFVYSAASNELNQSRLKVLKARDDVIQKLLVEAQKRLSTVGKGPQYQSMLQNLIVQVRRYTYDSDTFVIQYERFLFPWS